MKIKVLNDQLMEKVTFAYPPKRIISLVPSQTELLSELGLDNEVIGITKFCIHPSTWQGSKSIIGGTKNFWFDVIDELKPDLIIGNKEENYKEGILKLKERHPVWMSDIVTLEDSLDMINAIGELTGRGKESKSIVQQIQTSFEHLQKVKASTVLYLIWKKPWMGVGNNTFINNMLDKIGLKNCLHNETRYPELTADQIRSLNPDLIFLSSEPYPFQEQHINELETISPGSKVLLVDGEMFSWYGSRLIKAPDYFRELNANC